MIDARRAVMIILSDCGAVDVQIKYGIVEMTIIMIMIIDAAV